MSQTVQRQIKMLIVSSHTDLAFLRSMMLRVFSDSVHIIMPQLKKINRYTHMSGSIGITSHRTLITCLFP